MEQELATTKQPAYIWGMGENRDLRASLQSIGPQIPGLSFDGVLLDGRKKATMCAELRISFEIREAQTLAEACSILWTRHPARALELAGKRPVLELASLCGVSATAVAKELQATKPKKSHHKRRIEGESFSQLKTANKMVRRLFTLEPELYAYAREASAQLGHRNVNKLVRDALWEKVALLVPMAPQFQPRRVLPPNAAHYGADARDRNGQLQPHRAQRRRSG
jgi:hypothetical protein